MSYKSHFWFGAAQIIIGTILILCCFIVEPLWLIIWDFVFGGANLALSVNNIILGAKKLKEHKHEEAEKHSRRTLMK